MKIINKLFGKIKKEKTDVTINNSINDRSKQFQSRIDEIFDRLDNNPEKENLDKLNNLLEESKTSISVLKKNINDIDMLMGHFTDLYDNANIGLDDLVRVEVDRHRFTYGTLLVDLLYELEKDALSVKTKKKEKFEKMLIMSFTQYASRFNNKHARLTDEDTERYVKLTSKYADYTAGDMIPEEFKE